MFLLKESKSGKGFPVPVLYCIPRHVLGIILGDTYAGTSQDTIPDAAQLVSAGPAAGRYLRAYHPTSRYAR